MIICTILGIGAVAYTYQMNEYYDSYSRDDSDNKIVLDHVHSYYEEKYSGYIIIKCRNCGFEQYEYFPT